MSPSPTLPPTPVAYPADQLPAIIAGLERIDHYMTHLELDAAGHKVPGRKAFVPLSRAMGTDTAVAYLMPYLKEPLWDATDLLARQILVRGLLLWCKDQIPQ